MQLLAHTNRQLMAPRSPEELVQSVANSCPSLSCFLQDWSPRQLRRLAGDKKPVPRMDQNSTAIRKAAKALDFELMKVALWLPHPLLPSACSCASPCSPLSLCPATP